MLPEDVLLAILERLARLNPESINEAVELRDYDEWNARVTSRSRDASLLAATCVDARQTLRTLGLPLRNELLARGRTLVIPRACCFFSRIPPYPYLAQVRGEKRTCRHILALQKAHEHQALRTAGKSCHHRRASVNTQLRTGAKAGKAPRLHALTSLATPSTKITAFAAARDADVCFVQAVHGQCERIVQFQFCEGAVHERAVLRTTSSKPVDVTCMAAASDGSAVALIVYDRFDPQDYPDGRFVENEDGTIVSVWVPSRDGSRCVAYATAYEVNQHCFQEDRFSHSSYRCAQQVWWERSQSEDNAYKYNLVVAWSTTFVHESGLSDTTDSLDWVEEDEGPECYCFARYGLEHSGRHTDSDKLLLRLRYVTSLPRSNRRLLSCSADASGSVCVAVCAQEVAALGDPEEGFVYEDEDEYPGSWFCVFVDRPFEPEVLGESSELLLFRELATLDDGSIANTEAPVAAAISPSGLCVVVVCKHIIRPYRLKAQVFYVTSKGTWQERRTVVPVDRWLGVNGGFVRDQHAARLLKLHHTLAFSSCGRYVTVIDQRARFNLRFTGYAAVVIDLGTRKEATPLALCERKYSNDPKELSTLRCMQWSRTALWVAVGCDERCGLIVVA